MIPVQGQGAGFPGPVRLIKVNTMPGNAGRGTDPVFQKLAAPGFTVEEVIIVTNQFGDAKLSVYGLGRMAGAVYKSDKELEEEWDAKAKAKAVRCLSNEKQIALGYLLYAGDKSDYLPVSGIIYPGGVSPVAWFLEISPYVARGVTNAAALASFRMEGVAALLDVQCRDAGVFPITCDSFSESREYWFR